MKNWGPLSNYIGIKIFHIDMLNQVLSCWSKLLIFALLLLHLFYITIPLISSITSSTAFSFT